MNYINLKFQYQVIIFTLIFIASRIDNLVFFYNLNLDIDQSYKDSLNNNFWKYIFYQHVQSTGKIVYDKIIFLISNYVGLKSILVFYFVNILTSYIFYYFILLYINKIFVKNLIIKIFLFCIVIFFGIFFDNYELWRPHYHDHLTFMLVVIFATKLLFEKNFQKPFWIYFILFLITFSYTLGIIFFIISSVFILIFKYLNKENFLADIILILTITIIFFLLSFKNYYNVNVFSLNSNGGANLIQRTTHAIGNNNYYDLINNSTKLPEWFKVCNNYIYNNYENLKIINNDNFQSKLAHGLCFLDEKNNIDLFEFKKAISYSGKNKEFIKLIDKDLFNLKNKNWIFSGTHNELAYETTAAYTSYGYEIFFSALKNYPNEIVIGNIGSKGIALTFLQMLSYGSLLPEYYENFSYPLNKKYISYFYKMLSIFVILIHLVTPYVLFKKIKKVIVEKKLDYKDFLYFLFVSIVMVQIFLISTITCCENPRITVIFFPIIFIVLLFNIEHVLKKI